MIKIAIVVGTRPGHFGASVARRVFELAVKRSDADFELVDIQKLNPRLQGWQDDCQRAARR